MSQQGKPLTPEEIAATFAKADEVLKNAPVETMTIGPAPPEPKPGEISQRMTERDRPMSEPDPPEPKPGELDEDLQEFIERMCSENRKLNAELARLQARVASAETQASLLSAMADEWRANAKNWADKANELQARVRELEERLDACEKNLSCWTADLQESLRVAEARVRELEEKQPSAVVLTGFWTSGLGTSYLEAHAYSSMDDARAAANELQANGVVYAWTDSSRWIWHPKSST